MLKAYLSTQAPSLSDFVISKTLTSDQKPRGRQLNAKVCGHENATSRILLCFFLVNSLHAKCTFLYAYVIYARCIYICTGVTIAKPSETLG